MGPDSILRNSPTIRASAPQSARRTPDLVFLNIALESTDAIECVVALGKKNYSGYVQLMSSRGSAVLEHVKSIGQQQRLQMLASLKKPFETSAVLTILQDLKLGHPPALATRIELQDALRHNWIEFWYQPKIDLRKKQLVGVEAFARARHPQNGVLLPAAFMPGAKEPELIKLSELALESGLKANLASQELGVHLRLAVNIPVSALVKLAVADIVQSYRPQYEKWPGIIIDVPEEQIVTELTLASEIAKKLRPLDIYLAVDDFGRGYSSLAQVKELPFAELKLARTFIADCGTDKVNAPLCKTVIDLAHQFRQRRRRRRHRKSFRSARAGQYGLRLRTRIPAWPADAGRPFCVAAASARRFAGPQARRRGAEGVRRARVAAPRRKVYPTPRRTGHSVAW